MKIFDKMSDKLVVIADKVGRILYINIIRDTFSLLMPLVIAGALCTLVSNVVCSTTTAGPSLAKIGSLAFLEDFTPIFTAINFATLNFFAVAVAMMIGASLGAKRGLNSTVSSVVALASYITVCSSIINVTFGEETQVVSNVLSSDYTGSKGLFLAIIIGIVSVEILAKLIKSGKLAIHMPDMVPPNVTLAFSILFPACLTLFIISVFEFLVTSLTGMGLFDLIYSLVQVPLSSVVTGLPGVLLLMFVSQCFWMIGIHGNQMISAIRDPLLTAAILANSEAFEKGLELPNTVNQAFWYVFMQNGGSGCTLGLIIAIFIASKRQDHKAIAKLSLAPGIFGINETMTFGLPIVLNPLLAIPFVFTPLIGGIIGYVATEIGFAAKMMYVVPWTTPPIINGWLASGGDMGVVITQIICIIVSILTYLPFVLMMNKQTVE